MWDSIFRRSAIVYYSPSDWKKSKWFSHYDYYWVEINREVFHSEDLRFPSCKKIIHSPDYNLDLWTLVKLNMARADVKTVTPWLFSTTNTQNADTWRNYISIPGTSIAIFVFQIAHLLLTQSEPGSILSTQALWVSEDKSLEMWPHTMRLASCQNRFKPRLMAQSRKDSSHLARLPLAWSAPSVSQPIVFTTRPNLYQIFLLRSSIWMTIFSQRIGITKDMPSERLQRSLKVSPVSCLRLVNLKKHKKRWANLSLENLT